METAGSVIVPDVDHGTAGRIAEEHLDRAESMPPNGSVRNLDADSGSS